MDRIYLSLICLTLTITCCHSQGPKFPQIGSLIKNGFMSKVEISVMPEGYSVIVEELYDVSNKVTKVKTLKDGRRRTIILMAKTKQLAVIEDNTCNVQSYEKIKTVADQSFPTWLYSQDSDETFYGPTSVLRKAAESPPEYKEKTEIRGVSCHWYQGSGPDGVNIDYYFTADWTTPVNVSKTVQIPVQIRIGDEPTVQYVSYVYFIPTVSDRTVFEVTYGIGCEGLQNSEIKMPAIPKRFTVSGEQFSGLDLTADTYVNTFRVWYDSISSLARLDIFTKDDRGISKVLDYNTGVMYVTRDFQECSAVPLKDSYFDELTGDLKLVMKDPDSAMGMNGNFYYLGKQVTRGILCDVWEKVTPNDTIVELTVNRRVFTHFISSHWWEVAVDGEIEEQIPIRLEINTYVEATGPPTAKTIVNFFQFRKHPPLSFSPFNILNCASDMSARKYVGIIIEVDDEDLSRNAEGQAPMFRELAKNKIAEIGEISPVRLPYVRVDYDPGAITIMALLLERAPAMAQFDKLTDDVPRTKEVKKGTVKNAELCAEECINLEVCTGFHYCSEKGECYVSTYDWNDSWGDEVKGAKPCALYERHEAGSQFRDVLLKDALKSLNDAVTNKKFTIEIQVKDDVIEYVATDFQDDITPVTGGDYDKDMFTRVIGQKRFKSGMKDQSTQNAGEVLSASDCYRKCKGEINIACSSFSFCTDTNECLLSPTFVLPGKDIDYSLESSPLCSVYSINYLQMFEEYKGRVRVSPGKEAVSSDSASECAKSCREKGEKVCRGFDYCTSKKQCVFHDKHVLDIKGTSDDLTNVGSGCSHYALKYSADYVELGRFILFDPNSKSVGAISVEDCAKMCSENIEFKCRSFDFCKSDDVTKTQCTLNTLTLEDKVKSDDSATCQHYAKKDGLVEDYSQEKPPSAKASGYTSGQFAGVIIGVLILGIALGVIAFFIYAYVKKSRLTDGTAVKFVNE